MAETQKPRGKVVDLRGRLGLAPLLDELVAIFAQTDRDLGDASAALQRGIGNFGPEEVVRELCRRLRHLPTDHDSTPFVWALEQIGDRSAIEPLREMVEARQLAPRIRTDAAMVLHSLGEKVDLEALPAPGPEDAQDILQKILDDTDRQLAQVEPQERAFALTDLFDEIGRFMGQDTNEEMLQVLMRALARQENPLAADMLWTLSEFGPSDEVRADASQGLAQMLRSGLAPNPRMVTGTFAGDFGQAFASATGSDPDQGQLLFTWEQEPGRLLQFSFLLDFAHWAGGIKDFFVRPGSRPEEIEEVMDASREQGVPLVEITEADARRRIARAVQANIDHARPFPVDYRRWHTLVVRTLFGGIFPVDLPSPRSEAYSPLPGKAGAAEGLLRQAMPEAGFDHQQVVNACMLWRDFYQSHHPRITKAEVWAASVAYIIGCIEGRRDQTQQVVARQYGVSAGSVSARSGDVWDLFLDVERGSLAYASEKVRQDPLADALDALDNLLEDMSPEEAAEEDMLLQFQDYVADRQRFGAGIRELEFDEFRALTEELDNLTELEGEAGLSPAQLRRRQELERLLLLDRLRGL